MIGRWLSVFLVVQVLAPVSGAQLCPLPAEMYSDWVVPAGPQIGQRLIFFPNPSHPESDSLFGRVTFSTEDKRVFLYWMYAVPGGSYEEELEEFALSYRPTAISKQLGVSTTFYVAGFSERTCQVIVEEWVVQNVAFATTLHPVTEEPTTVMHRVVSRTLLLASDQLAPIKALVYHPGTNELWFFHEGFPHQVSTWSLNTPGAPVVPLVNSTTAGYSFLEYSLWAAAAVVKPGATNGGGFLVVVHPSRPWQDTDEVSEDAGDHYMVLQDSNCDGAVDHVYTGTHSQVIVDTGFRAHEIVEYQSCPP